MNKLRFCATLAHSKGDDKDISIVFGGAYVVLKYAPLVTEPTTQFHESTLAKSGSYIRNISLLKWMPVNGAGRC